mgnify:FL=1
MKKVCARIAGLLFVIFTLSGCITPPPSEVGWITLFDGTHLNNFKRVGDANWRLDDGMEAMPTGASMTAW